MAGLYLQLDERRGQGHSSIPIGSRSVRKASLSGDVTESFISEFFIRTLVWPVAIVGFGPAISHCS